MLYAILLGMCVGSVFVRISICVCARVSVCVCVCVCVCKPCACHRHFDVVASILAAFPKKTAALSAFRHALLRHNEDMNGGLFAGSASNSYKFLEHVYSGERCGLSQKSCR